MREESAFAFVEGSDFQHVALGQGEVEYFKIFLHAFFVSGFRNDDHAPLNEKSKRDLSGRFLILLTNVTQYRIREEIFSSFGKRTPALVCDAVFIHPLACLCLLLEDMRFHLVDHWFDVDKPAQIDEAVGIKIGNADCAQLTCR